MTSLQLEKVAAEQLLGGNVRKAIADAHLQWVRDYHGDDAVQSLLRRLPASICEDLWFGCNGWLPFASLIELDRAIQERFGRGRRSFLRELGRYSAHLNLSAHGFRGEAVHDFFHRLARLHGQFRDAGYLTYEEQSVTSGRIVLRDAVCYSSIWCASAAGYYEQALTMLYAIPLRVEETRCRADAAEICTFELEWA